jgi:hypothetical protein
VQAHTGERRRTAALGFAGARKRFSAENSIFTLCTAGWLTDLLGGMLCSPVKWSGGI